VFFKAASSIFVIDVFRELHACICSGKSREEEVRVMMAYIIYTTWNTGSARLHLSLPLKTMNFCQKKESLTSTEKTVGLWKNNVEE
jgi:hypothetical protein